MLQNSHMERFQTNRILQDLNNNKIVFIVGPRQVGKTWLSKEISHFFSKPIYLNYDNLTDRKIIVEQAWLFDTDLIILDELHKMPNWKNFLKGLYDTKPDQLKIIVTGSARLDTFRKSGDSLAGRFFTHHLLPFSIAELKNTTYANDLERFLERSGFPEPFLADDLNFADRWRAQYVNGLIRTDILDFEKIHDLKSLELILELLKERVGSPISYASIARDLNIAPNTVKKYLQILEALYIVFFVTPYSKNIARSIIKEPKAYFFDTGLVKNLGSQFENFVGLSLYKLMYANYDYYGKNYKLQYLKTKEGKEIDFCIVKDNQLDSIIEVKLSDSNLSKELLFFSDKYQIKGFQIVKNLINERKEKNIEIRRAVNYLKELWV